jgi:hypothetical protein
MKRRTSFAIAVVAALVSSGLAGAQAPPAGSAASGDGPQYASGNNLIPPANYREWSFLSSSLGLTYQPSSSDPVFQNVFVNPSSYRSFMQTGKWPDKTVFVLEFRGSKTETSKNGRFQSDLTGIEAEVKDSRFPDGWAYFGYGPNDLGKPAGVAPLSASQATRCVECHTQHTAVERTFVQFYPTLFEVAKRRGTVKPNYTDP